MRYLKVFGIPAFICICMTITMCMYPEKNSEETLNNSSEITNYESPSEEEINNVVETSSFAKDCNPINSIKITDSFFNITNL